ncbi:conserved hypothetical protein; putative exported protein [Xenorhabdus bovienii str. kraussei Quebec]|uniref:Uncharacterized protein n=1 Tax=Xenorhabdus bovienii str. kraussei Quebec TaxID=1398203 RepID=A0A077PQ40_XENBV|nr:fimbrial protein [Xenorhabdus bovienii]MDE9446223.1 type 1 fimbrial protein [Xenorhabdus bovienii]CDH21954.1 conserved hypothetical protein; putative exported protein [Xenorhabdus bovienii str. kraussei Quebec]
MINGLKLLLASTFIVGIMSSFDALASYDCQYSPGFSAGTTYVSFGTVVIPRDHSIGTTIKEIRLDHVDEKGNIAICNTLTPTSWEKPDFDPAHYNYDAIYESGVPGVGIRINTWGPGYGIDWLPRTATYPVTCSPPSQFPNKKQYCGRTWGYLTVQLIKIAPTTSSGPTHQRLLTRAKLGLDLPIHTFFLTNTYIMTQGCSLKQKTTFVNMGEVRTSAFRGMNSTADMRNFELNLDCDANVKVGVTLDGRPAKSNANNIWALDDNSDNVTATGIGLQILYQNQPLSMGSPLMIHSGQAIGNFAIPLHARYIQTEGRVTPGKADATATITLTYQ